MLARARGAKVSGARRWIVAYDMQAVEIVKATVAKFAKSYDAPITEGELTAADLADVELLA